MPVSRYLPSAQFTLVVTSVALAGGLVLFADYLTSPQSGPNAVVTTDAASGIEPMDWERTLASIQGNSTLPEPIDPATMEALRTEATTNTLTGTVGRSLLLNLSEAKSQGLGSDFPTQERLVANAAAQAAITRGNPAYGAADLTAVASTDENLKTYGNATVTVISSYANTSFEETLLAVGQAVDSGKKSELAALTAIQAEYQALTASLLALPVPEILVPLHLQIVNNLARVTELYADLQATLTDPLRGIGALKLYQSLAQENARLFTNIARIFEENGILFASEEPGATWSLLLTLESSL